jgi:aspartyl-tRNA(Asn)/glutamyl-tRNA(Gln) amidotransferase subunit B
MKFKTTIGLEIHVQLKTKSKMFCRCDNESDKAKPNTNVCPRCLGMPGTLPVANRQAIEWTIKTGLALNCKINEKSKFDRKHYFYPDLPKGYQISQYDEPLCRSGNVELQTPNSELRTPNSELRTPNSELRTIRINRVHLEEDAGKLIHKNGSSYVDLNRAGTPLMEIVTEPDIASPAEEKKFLQELQLIVRYLGVCEASMEKGHLRCDANIDLKDDKGNMSEIVELKNINSFRFIERALLCEERRLQERYPNWSEKKAKVTRGYDSKKDVTFEQREKEEASDYRYFPEPDVPAIAIDNAKLKTDNKIAIDIENIKAEIGELPEDVRNKLRGFGVTEDIAEKIAIAPDHARYISDAKRVSQALASWITNEVAAEIAAQKITHDEYRKNVPITHLSELLALVESGKVSKNSAKEIFKEMVKSGKRAVEIIQESGLEQMGEDSGLEEIIYEIFEKNPKEHQRLADGDDKLIGFFMGEVMRETGGRANPKTIRSIILDIKQKKKG